ncbi:S-layer family protein [Paenibacillus taihuensis]|uniref:S-layer family protein n=1 Tax=Paenibacillus taihuensis TaxID=1156355 RepID=A0A3D9QU06_9BACL|nr:S-layer homology domain-containing protein [Paenibacillus taihuensis]REE66716.1 S-layer family protein [Paenibacillus taihuensis]
MNKQTLKAVLRWVVIASMLLTSIPFYSDSASANIVEPTVTSAIFGTTVNDTSAYLLGTAVGFGAGTQVGYEYSKNSDMSDSVSTAPYPLSGTYVYGYLWNLDRGTTYYYRAFASSGGDKVYGEIESFKTAIITGLDVRDSGGTTLGKTPFAFSYTQTGYEVDVPYGTTSVSVVESADLGTAQQPLNLGFSIVGDSSSASTEPWHSTLGSNIEAVHTVNLTSDSTVVCVGTMAFAVDTITPSPCSAGQFAVTINRLSTSVTTTNAVVTDTTAFLIGAADGFGSSTPVGFEYSEDENFETNTTTTTETMSGSSIYSSLSDLDRGATYYYRAYAEVDGRKVYGNILTFKTAIITGIDVKNSGITLDKSPSAFSYDETAYTVHVPRSTTSVSVVESADLGTAAELADLDFAVDGGNTVYEPWQAGLGSSLSASHEVSISANTTTVCVGGLTFAAPGILPGPCSQGQYTITIIRDSGTVTTTRADVTDMTAFLFGTTDDFDSSTPVGFEYSKSENFSTSTTTAGVLAGSSIYSSLEDLDRGATYYYRAYAEEDDVKVYGATLSFKTAIITGIDVKNSSGTTLEKLPASFSYNDAAYTVHVPHNTTSVSVVETVDRGTAPSPMNLVFTVGGSSSTEPWQTVSGSNISSTHTVAITADTTIVYVCRPVFTRPNTTATCNSEQFAVTITRDPGTVTTTRADVTDTTAFLIGTADEFDSSTQVGFEYSEYEDFRTSATTTEALSGSSIYSSLSDLNRGTTYYYRAYAEEDGVKVYGATLSFKTAIITGIDVKNSGTTLTKSPSAFGYLTTAYTVHVPHSTTNVSVVETVDRGTAPTPIHLGFSVGGSTSSEPWQTVSGSIISSTHTVAIEADSTIVCVSTPEFASPASAAPVGPCASGKFAITIIRDAAPQSSAPTPPPSVVLVLDSNPNSTNESAKTAMTQIVGTDLKMSAQLMNANGEALNIPEIPLGADGSFSLQGVPSGQYTVALSVIAPTGEKLAGRIAKLTVNSDGSAKLEAGLIDPYGIVTDAVTGKTIEGAKVTLHWMDTKLNSSKGRKAGDLVVLPELPDFKPNQNHDPQTTVNGGQYGWMVFPDGDYYITAEKDGYETFDSRKDTRNEQQGVDSYIKDGNIHVGQSIVQYSFAMHPKVIASGEHKPYMLGYPDGSFRPERGITRAEIAAILSRLFTGDQAAAVSFADVKKTHWAAKEIAAVTAQKWMVGYPDGNFRPDQQVTRAEFAQILLNVKKWNPVSGNVFEDAKGHWAATAIATLAKQGLLQGYPDGTFRPNQSIKRVEADVVFNELLGRHPWKVQTKPIWTDVDSTYWGYDAVMEASIPHMFEQYESGEENWKS